LARSFLTRKCAGCQCERNTVESFAEFDGCRGRPDHRNSHFSGVLH